MTNPARSEELHYCARCHALIEQEEAEKNSPRESGVVRTTLQGVAVEPTAPVVTSIPIAPIPEIVVAPDVAPDAELSAPVEPAAPMPTIPMAALAEIAPEVEHRAAPRKQIEVDVGIHSDSHFFAGLTGDVSRGGLFVATYARIPVGGRVTLDFELPNGKISAHGTVRWHRAQTDNQAPGFGVQFENVEPAMMKLIERFCQARPPLYYDQADDLE